jgi:hypothetical protein
MYIRSTLNGKYLHLIAMETYRRKGHRIWEGGRLTCEHRDQNPCNNVVANLSLATKREQCESRRGNSHSKLPDVKGVSPTVTGSFLVELKHGTCRLRKTVKDLMVAKLVYNLLATEICGPRAHKNNVHGATGIQHGQANAIAHALLSTNRPAKRARLS